MTNEAIETDLPADDFQPSPEELEPEFVAPAFVEPELPAMVQQSAQLRGTIDKYAGDVLSRQGKHHDLLEVMLLMMGDVFGKIHKAEDMEAVRASVADYIPTFVALQAGMEAGQVKMVHQAKGMEPGDVVTEALTATTAVATVFERVMAASSGDQVGN